jgi:uncharacterized protein DUF4175
MTDQGTNSHYDELRSVIRGVRRRWRLKVGVRGAAIVLAASLLAFGLAAYAMDRFRYEDWAVTSFRLFAYVALFALTTRFMILPLWGRVSDERVALYLEEREPSLQAAVLSAVEAGQEKRTFERSDVSRALVERLVETAVEKCQTIDFGRPAERPALRRASALLAAAAALGMAVAILSPAFLRHAAPYLFAPWLVRAASPYAIEVDPGHVTIPRGGSQTVTARLLGFDAETVELLVRSGQAGEWKRWAMTADQASRGFRFVLFGLETGSDYYAEAGGVRSPVFRVEVADVPYVKKIDLEYRFPSYTGLAPQAHEDTGDVVALRGTEVRVRVTPTMKVAAGRLRLDGAAPRAMTLEADGTLQASFTVAEEGFYRIELPRRDGDMQTGSPDYTIDVLADQPPSVTIRKPGRDAKVTNIEEVFTELEAEDDYGVGRAELVYSVNGAAEKTVVLHQGRARKDLTAGHTFFLEELTLEPGDFISYYARAADQSQPSQTTTTDIYFMEVRPFGREYRQAEQRGAGGGGGAPDDALSFQQRQIIAATFKLVRDRRRIADKQYGEDLGVLALAQGRLQAQVQSLVQRMANRGVLEPGSGFDSTAQSLRSAGEEMGTARERLAGNKAKDALPPEQAALKHLQRAEAAFRDVQVSFEQQGGGGGGGSAMNAEDLADLFELELDKLKNQYETVQRGSQEKADDKVDEALERLRELARRQEQEIERARRLAGQLPNQAGGGGGSQRDLARETEELARRLERLARETSSAAMQDTARRLQEAANAMKRSGTGATGGSAGEAAAALERLRDAQRGLEGTRANRLEQGVQDALRKAQGLARAQEGIAAEAEEQAAGQPASGGGLERLLERKDGLASEVAGLEGELDRMARDARRGKKDAARKLQEAADAIRDTKLQDKIRYSKGVVRAGRAEQSRRLEGEIGSDLEALGQKLQEAASAAGPSAGDKRSAALERMRDLVRRLESAQDRLGDVSRTEGESPHGSPGEGSSQEGSSSAGSSGDGSPGQTSAGGRDGGGAPGSPRLGSPTGGGPRAWAPGQARHLRRELRERLREAEGLGKELGGGPRGDLQEVIRAMRAFEDERIYREPRGLAQLVASVVEGLKSAEFALRRDVEGPDREKLTRSGTQDLPPGWQRLVEEYYRSLSKKPANDR